MKKETSQQSLSELQTRHSKLSGIVEQRKKLFDRIGTGSIKTSDSENATDRVIKVRRRVRDKIAHFQEEIGLIEEHISTLPLPITIFPEATQQTPGFPRTVETKEEKEIPLPVVFYDKEKRRVQVESQDEKAFREGVTWRIFQELLDNPGLVISSYDLYDIALEAGQDRYSTTAISTYIAQIRTRVGKDLIKTKGKTKMSAGYYFDAIVRPFEQEESPKKAGRSRKEIIQNPILNSRLDALVLVICDPDTTLDEVIDTVGLTKRGKKMTWMQANRALINAIGLMKYKISKQTITDREQALWDEFKANFELEDNHEAHEMFKVYIDTWFRKKREEQFVDIVDLEAEEEVSEKEQSDRWITFEEAAVLSTLIQRKRGKNAKIGNEIITFEVPEDILMICDSFVDKIAPVNPQSLTGKNDQFIRNRVSVLQKVEDMLSSDEASLLDNYDENINTLLIWLFVQNEDKMARQLFDFLAYESRSRTLTDRGGLILDQKEDIWVAKSVDLPALVVTSREEQNGSQDSLENLVDTTLADITEEPTIIHVSTYIQGPAENLPEGYTVFLQAQEQFKREEAIKQETQENARLELIKVFQEKNVDIVNELDSLLKETKSLNFGDGITVARLTREFNNITWTFIQQQIANRNVVSSNKRGKPIFSEIETIKLVMIKKYDLEIGGFSNTRVGQLTRLVAERLEEREKKAKVSQVRMKKGSGIHYRHGR